MTREEAVARIKDHIEIHRYHERNAVKIFEALDMAIKALKQPEPCEDAVSRHRLLNDLKELIAAWEKYPVMAEQKKGVETAIGYVKTIPSVMPDRKQGKWLDGHRAGYGESLYWYIYCSECLYERDDDDHDKDTPFCPNCGCQMERSTE